MLEIGPSASSMKLISPARAKRVLESSVPLTETIMPIFRSDTTPGWSSSVTDADPVSKSMPLTTTLPKPLIGPTTTTSSAASTGKVSGALFGPLSPQADKNSAMSGASIKPFFMIGTSLQPNAAEMVGRMS